MAGIYVHIPFCRRKCLYCDFYSVGERFITGDFDKLINHELLLRGNFLNDKRISTVYLGGGTPSLLPIESVGRILEGIDTLSSLNGDAEITIEVNPDDVSLELFRSYKRLGVNRISIGVQSFNQAELSFLGRRHSVESSSVAVHNAQDAGFENISIDLIYGIPGSTLQTWEHSLSVAENLNPQHLSCYHLTYEGNTPLTRRLRKGLFTALDEELSLGQFELLRSFAQSKGYLHYEVSNFAKEGFISRHNSSYWLGEEYLGLGPAAHSYNGAVRQWNPYSLERWEDGIKNNSPNIEMESLSAVSKYNELLITRLRTIWGVNTDDVSRMFGESFASFLNKSAQKYIDDGRMSRTKGNTLLISPSAYFVSDSIVENLMLIAEPD
ncbi:MAG: radical SAM family heme chaperone HemW [Bacteroidales bacterium]|nr:radical SAM family heme chaperone HemW [Bacteroidales bacterium]HOA10505.1 radical SAM family heme chaperone HemW [Tenuifilaceae bacterium]MBP8644306.1 radical SAM family heme chaperone HemW [Bacteroidales bacterium]NLI87503.1 radical SAM family heme chaperone HemW [Bacteroidales bacterium]HOC37020.1 radical SAM family heme chaperone HemW [Tenuifilaceae bacterium]